MDSWQPPLALRSAHLQSVLGNSLIRRRFVLKRAASLLAASHDELADCGDGVRLLLHHTPPQISSGRLALLIHGWEGSGKSTYMLAASARLWAAGYRVLRLNLRDHGDSHHLNRELFHSCRLREAIGAVQWVQSRFPDELLMLGGISLGGNFALRVAADAAQFKLSIARVAAVCPVLDPVETMYALDDGWLLYRQYFLVKWRRSLETKRKLFPADYDFGDLRRFRSLRLMTEFFVENYTEFPDLLTYLRGYAITGDRLKNLAVSSWALLAKDDPVIPITGLDRMSVPDKLHIDTANFGGHCGFLLDYALSSGLEKYLLQAFETSHETHNPVA